MMTLAQKRELYQQRSATQREEISVKEWQKRQSILIHRTGCGLVLITTILMWIIGGK